MINYHPILQRCTMMYKDSGTKLDLIYVTFKLRIEHVFYVPYGTFFRQESSIWSQQEFIFFSKHV